MADKTNVYESPESSGRPGGVPPEKVKVYEQKKTEVPIWVWLLPVFLLLGVGIWIFSRHHNTDVAAAQSLGYVNFDTDRATLTSESQATLNHAADLMKQRPDMRLRVQGFTDSTGDPAHNVALSNQRSDAVTQYLTSKGIDKSRLNPEGFGEEHPRATNATADGKADNRRVELFQQ